MQLPSRARPWALACVTACAAGSVAGHQHAVFLFVDADGTPRYADQAMDASYRELLAPSPQPSRSTADEALIHELATAHGVGVSLVRAVVAVESGGRPNAVSPKGARGLMQLMPSTASALGLRTSQDLHDPRRNLDAGIRHLKQLLASHQGNVALALAAYNAGSGAVARHGQRIPPYRETMLYVPAVLARTAQP